jgi:hypothetical protein
MISGDVRNESYPKIVEAYTALEDSKYDFLIQGRKLKLRAIDF